VSPFCAVSASSNSAIRPGLAEADIVLQQHIASDEKKSTPATASCGRSWALPVLGLIGTVIGISLAVGGFALFLGTGAEDVALIKKNLVALPVACHLHSSSRCKVCSRRCS